MLSLPVEVRGMTPREQDWSFWWTLPSDIHGLSSFRLYYEAAGL